MTKEEKDLLLKDLCARQYYEVKVLYEGQVNEIQYIEPRYCEVKLVDATYYTIGIEEIKPYLRPMSSMTEEERQEYGKVCELDTEMLANSPMNGEPFPALYNSQDWLNKKMFDFRGLIPKDLAIAVTDENNPYKD